MREQPHFLVVIPAHDAEAYILETLASVQAQTYESWNAIVVDDASTDTTAKIVSDASLKDSRIHLIVLEKNHGRPSVPRNRAIQAAIERDLPFDFVSFLDSDDLWEPGKIRADAERFVQDPSLGMVHARHVFHLSGDRREEIDLPEIRGVWDLAWRNAIYCSSVTIARSVVSDFAPLFDEDPLLKAVEDTELWFRLLSANVRCASVEDRSTVYRLRDSSISRVGRIEVLRRLVYLYAKAAMKNPRIPLATFYLPLAYRVAMHLGGYLVYSPFESGKKP